MCVYFSPRTDFRRQYTPPERRDLLFQGDEITRTWVVSAPRGPPLATSWASLGEDRLKSSRPHTDFSTRLHIIFYKAYTSMVFLFCFLSSFLSKVCINFSE